MNDGTDRKPHARLYLPEQPPSDDPARDAERLEDALYWMFGLHVSEYDNLPPKPGVIRCGTFLWFDDEYLVVELRAGLEAETRLDMLRLAEALALAPDHPVWTPGDGFRYAMLDQEQAG